VRLALVYTVGWGSFPFSVARSYFKGNPDKAKEAQKELPAMLPVVTCEVCNMLEFVF